MIKPLRAINKNPFSSACRIFLCFAVVLASDQFCASYAEAALIGEAELGYVNYQAEVNGAKAIDASSFRQRYSLLYSTNGALANGRLGNYRVSLGYEWISFDTKLKTYPAGLVSNDDRSISAGHLLYRGEIKIDPQLLPIKIRAYSFDLTRANFISDINSPLVSYDGLINPGVTTSLRDGTRIQSGINVDIGLKNTTAAGYNSIFGQLPRLFIEYQDNITKDLKSFTQSDNRLRKLAFVSLNKKDNWFHVRTVNYTDYLNPDQSYKETQVILGSIDQGMQRKWVDFSNWIKVSADGNFVKHVELDNTFEAYQVNLFGTATRSSWEAKTYNSFRRVNDQNSITYETKLPLYLTGYAGDDTDWRVRLSTDQSTQKFTNSTPDDINNTLASYRIDTFKRESFTLMHSAGIKYFERSQNGKTLSINGHLETGSTRRLSSTYGLFASYDVTSANNEPYNGQAGTSLTQVLDAKAVYTPTNSLRLELIETMTMANGNSFNDLTGASGGQATNNASGGLSFTTPTSSYYRFRTMARANWEPLARLRLGFSVTDDLLKAQGSSRSHGIQLEQTLDYTTKAFKIHTGSRYFTSDDANITNSGIATDGGVIYTPDRSLESSVSYSYTNSDNNIDSGSSMATLRQSTNYYLYTDYGVSRRVLELNQALEFEKQTYATYKQTTRSVIGGFKYYPLSRLYIGGRVKYSLISYQDATQTVYNATVGFNFNLMQATIDYSYGRQNGNPNRLERRLEANLKKTF